MKCRQDRGWEQTGWTDTTTEHLLGVEIGVILVQKIKELGWSATRQGILQNGNKVNKVAICNICSSLRTDWVTQRKLDTSSGLRQPIIINIINISHHHHIIKTLPRTFLPCTVTCKHLCYSTLFFAFFLTSLIVRSVLIQRALRSWERTCSWAGLACFFG
jgi:hypothetical protein